MAEEKKTVKPRSQNLILENREKLSVSGVIDVESFNDECIVIETDLGMLTVRGEDLHINRLNIDSSELDIEGDNKLRIQRQGQVKGSRILCKNV